RLAHHAGARDVGVIATFTNAVGAATYPLPATDNALPDGYTVASLDELFAHANAGQAEPMPVLHGPGLYFSAGCLAAVGAFARRVDLLRLAELPKQLLVFVSHPWGGGIRRYMNDLAALVDERAEVLYLEPAADDTVKLYWPRAGESFAAYFHFPDELPLLVDVLKSIGVARLHFHHVHKLPRAILELPSAAGLPFDCTLHDYFSICPQYHLVTED